MKNLTEGNIYKTFFLFGFPLVLSGLLSQAYQTIDTSIAGKFLGETGLAAIGATSPLITFLSSIFWGYGAGFCIHVARMFGSGEYRRIKSAVYSNYFFLSALCVLLSAAMLIFHDQIFDFLNIEENLRKDAFAYFAVYVAGLLPIMLSFNGVYLMNAFGIGTYPFFMSLLSAVVNIAGNIFCVTVLNMGVAGLAAATVFSAFVVDVFYIAKLLRCFKEMNVQTEKATIRFSFIKDSLPYSCANMCQQMIMYFSGFLISPLVNDLGKSAAASYSVVSRLYDINASVYQNSARSLSNYAAQCVGEEKYDRIKKGVWAGFLQGVVFVLPFILVSVIFREQICSLFFKENDSLATKQYSYDFAQYYLPFLLFNVVCNLFHALYRGVKATGYLVSSTCIASVVRYVASVLLIGRYGMHGFFAGWVISWIAEAIYAVILFFIGKWNPAKNRQTEKSPT